MVINVRLLLAVAVGAVPLTTTDPLLAAAVLGALLLVIAALRVDLPTLSVATNSRSPKTKTRVAIEPQTTPAGPGRPQPRAPGARSCASS